MTVLLALLAAAAWGSADFVGGLLSRRRPAVVVLAWASVVATVVASTAVLATGLPLPDGRWALWGGLAAVCGTTGLGALYAGLAAGRMGVVAPIAATGVLVPVTVGLVGGDPMTPVIGAGILCAVTGGVLASGPEAKGETRPDEPGGSLPVVLAVVAALGLGSSLVFVERGAHVSVLHTLWVLKLVGLLLLLLVLTLSVRLGRLSTPSLTVERGMLPGLVVLGTGDLCANALYGLAAQGGPLSVVSVLGSLYPVATITLAWVVLHERLRPVQWAGVALALVGIALIAS